MSKKLRLVHSLLLCGLSAFISSKAHAQLTPDNTLGAESSRINPNVLIKGALGDSIDGGAQRGINLFHSFSEFNIKDGQRVHFVNPAGVTNILTRVTGSNASNILGTLGVDGAANLFLINPNGILFGKNASLDIGGSFVGTTANALQFGNQGIFSATNPSSAPLLTINPSAFLFNQINPGSIVNQSQAPAGINPAGNNITGLRVPDGKSFVLVGGDINLDGGGIRAYSGRVELAGLLTAPGSIGLNVAGDEISLNVGNNLQLADISLSNEAAISVFGISGGDIIANARNLNMDNSGLYAGISGKSGSGNTTAGNITLNATGATTATQASQIFNYVDIESYGNAGNINIKTGSLQLTNGTLIDSSNLGKGDSGNIIIDASNVSLLDGSSISSNVLGQGNGGNIQINARDTIKLSSAVDYLGISGIYNQVGVDAKGDAGNININTNSLSLLNGSEINSKTFGQGNAGNININAQSSLTLDGFKEATLSTGSVGKLYSRITSLVNWEGTGKAGDINIKTPSLQLTNGAFISSDTLGKGDAGNIVIDASDVALSDGALISNDVSGIGFGGDIQINANTLTLLSGSRISNSVLGQGNGGNIFVNARDIKLDGIVNSLTSGIKSYTSQGSIGNSGNIQITTGSMSITNGANINTNAAGKGNAGSIYIQASDKVSLSNANNIGYTAISNFVDSGYGNGAVINIETGDLLLDNAVINSYSFGKGSAGSIFINAKNTVALTNQSRFASSTHSKAEGNGGDINIQSEKLSLDNGSYFTADTFGQGNGGNISIKTTDSVSLVNNSRLTSSTFIEAVGNSGDININTIKLSLDANSYLSTISFGKGNGGNITVKSTDFSLLNKSYIASGLYQTSVGNGGNIDIQNAAITIENGSSIASKNDGGKGNAGDIRINTIGNVFLKNASQINAATFGEGSAGDITVNSGGTVSLDSTGSDTVYSGIYSIVGWNAGNVGKGKGGNINLNARNLFMNRAGLSSSSFSEGDGGDINVNTGAARLDNQSTIQSVTNSDNGGNIKFNATDYLLLRRNSSVQTTAGLDNKSGGNGGNINIQAPFIIALPNEYSFIAANAFTGSGGNVRIGAESVIGIDARNKPTGTTSEITASSQFGVQGTVGITQPEIQPTKTIISLPVQVVDATTKLSQICPRDIGSKPLGEFVITGRGSLPPSPLEPLPGAGSLNLATLDIESRQVQKVTPIKEAEAPIIEAQGFIKNNDGSIELVASAPTVNALSTTTQASCPSMAPPQTSKS